MHRSRTLRASLGIALVVGWISTVNAWAAPSLVLRTSAGPLAAGAPIQASSTNLIFETAAGNIECEQNTLTGTLTVNQASKDVASFTEASFAGNFTVAGACKTSAAGPVIVTSSDLPWPAELSAKGTGLVRGTNHVAFTLEFLALEPSQNQCSYEATQVRTTSPAGPEGSPIQFIVTTTKQSFKIVKGSPQKSPLCPPQGLLSGTFEVLSGLESVQAELGSNGVEVPNAIEGVVRDGANQPVANASVTVCQEESEPPACFSSETEAAGKYVVTGMANGFFTVTARGPAGTGSGFKTVAEVVVNEGATTQDVTLPEGGAVEGIVTNASASPLANVSVKICDPAEEHCFGAETEAAGHYSVPSLADGSYVAHVKPAPGIYAGVTRAGVTVSGTGTTTEDFTLPEAATVTGTVTGNGGALVVGADVIVCSGTNCYTGTTDASGVYSIGGVADGAYAVTVFPTGSEYDQGTSPQFTVTGTATVTRDVTLTGPIAAPSGTVITGFTTTTVGGVAVPIVNWSQETPITTEGCPGGHVTGAIRAVNLETGLVEVVGPVTLTENAPSGSGVFSGMLPATSPVHGGGQVVIEITGCANPAEEETIEVSIYIDPSGVVVDANHGDAPVAGATVTLLRAEAVSGPFTAVADGSAVMSPANRTNPDTTDSPGEFGWDTIPGFYEVKASKSGCGSAVTPAFPVPPPQTGLTLDLHCSVLNLETTSLPKAMRGVHYEATLVAGGEDPPFKWKKTAALPKGLKLSKAGVLSGTVNAKKVGVGVYPVSVQVSDAKRHTASTTLMLKVG